MTDPRSVRVPLTHPPQVASDAASREERRAELAERLQVVRERIVACSVAAGRDPRAITLIAVTKGRPVSDIRLLHELGVGDIGENRDQEAAAKAAHCADLPITWHFVGQLQTNKCASVARYAHVVHSVDRLRLVSLLGRAARRAGRLLTCLVQVNLDPAGTWAGRAPRGGAPENQVTALAEAVAGEAGLRLGGVMAVAPLGAPPRPVFERLVRLADLVRSVRDDAIIVSAGMSGDFEEAIAAGATHLRIGTALLGDRGPDVR